MLQIRFNLVRIVGFGQPQSIGDAFDMRVHDDGRLIECIPKHDVGGFPPDPRQRDQVVHGAGDLSVKSFRQGLAAGDNVLSLALEEAGRANELFDVREAGLRQIRGGSIAFEQRRCDFVDSFIGALGRQDGCHEQFPR